MGRWGWSKKRSFGRSRFSRFQYDPEEDSLLNDILAERLMMDLIDRHNLYPSQPHGSQSVMIDDDEDDDLMGHDDLDDEICFGHLRGNIVGIQYYSGTVNMKEMVALEREPENRYDINAIKVKNVGNVQVGHIKRELARPLAYIMDKGLARLEGVVPFGATNMYSMPVDISLWGKPENQKEAVDKLKKSGFYLTGGTQPVTSPGSGMSSSSLGASEFSLAAIEPRRTYLTPAEVKNELDKLFENIEEGDKTSLADPAQAIATPLYPHQKQALNWMVKRENNATLPPFWQEKNGKYFNTVLNFTSSIRPDSVRGGILADDMGLGKTLEMITLIITNFVDNKPLATPVDGLVRQSKSEKMAGKKSKMLPTSSSLHSSMKKTQIKLEKKKSLSCYTENKLLVSIASSDNIETPALPDLPDDEEVLEISNDDEDDDDEEEIADLPAIDDRTMLKKDDPDFSPMIKKKEKKTKAKENVTPEEASGRRPRRSVKRPVRYAYSSEEDEAINDETPKKKAREEVVNNIAESNLSKGKGKAPASGKKHVKKGKPKKVLLNDKALPECKKSEDIHQDKIEDDTTLVEVKNEMDDGGVAGKSETDTKNVQNQEAAPVEMMSGQVFDNLQPEAAEAVKKMSDRIKELEALLSSQQVPSSQPVGKVKENKTECTQPLKLETQTHADVKSTPLPSQVKQEPIGNNPTGKTGDHVKKEMIDDLPDLDENIVATEELPDIPPVTCYGDSSNSFSSDKVVTSNYTKAEVRELGESTGRTFTTGPRCTLIVCPLSVLSNWLDQLEDHVHRNVHLSIYLYYGSGRTKNSHLLESQDVVITTYSTVSADFKKGARNPLKKVKWLRIVLDEGHAIKNPLAQQTKAILELDAQRKWVLTGFSSDKVVTSNYTKAEVRELGESTGRTFTTGPRCTLIVCPLSVLSNWLDQLEDHVHRNVHLSIYLYYGSGRTKNSHLLESQDVVITTYSTVSADFKKGARNPLKKVKWLRIVLDEGHAIKNPLAQQTKAILELDAQRKWVLTGTPIQNSMKDLWSLINFLKVNPFTDKQWWRRTIERPLEKGDESALKRVQHLMGHLALRRTKTQEVNGKPLVQLPERKVFIEHVKLSEEERKTYDSMQNEGRLIVSKYFKQGTLLHHYGDVLAILMRLRQLCCHPFLVAKAAAAVKDTIAEIDRNGGVINEELRKKLIDTLIMVLSSGTDEECAICLDSLKTPVITHCAHVFCRPCIETVIRNERPHPKCPLCRGAIEDDKLLEVPPEKIQDEKTDDNSIVADTWKSSAKVDALMNALLKLRSKDGSIKSIVVSQFTSLLTLLETPLSTNGFNFVRLDGTMSSKARSQAIEEFSDPTSGSPTIFLLSLKAGGVGINLTAASRVFLIDPAWNPASEEQCFDRCHRLGQTKDVIITKFIVEDSVEERMMELQEKKRKLMQGAFGQKQSAEQKRQARIKDIKTLFAF